MIEKQRNRGSEQDSKLFEVQPSKLELVQVNTAEGKQCTATIISPYWIATSESCCDGAVKGILEFDDWRTGSGGSGGTAGPSYNVPATRGLGRRRRTVEFNRQRSKRDTGGV